MESVPTDQDGAVRKTDEPEGRSRLFAFRLAIALIWTVVIMLLCWIPGRMVHKIEDGSGWLKIPSLDKLVHGAIFIVFAVLWARVGIVRRRFVWIAIAGIGLAVLTELVQELPLVGRDGNLADGAVDLAGVLLGVAAAPLFEPLARLVESKLFKNAAPEPVPPIGSRVTVE